MTLDELPHLSPYALDVVFAGLTATDIPVGMFDGRAWIAGHAWTARLFGLVWSGKIFTADRVVNQILGHRWIHGDVRLHGRDILIDYPRLRLRDQIRPCDAGYLGRLRIGTHTVHFTLHPHADQHWQVA